MILTPYSASTARLLADPPATGKGRHLWLFKVAARLIHAGADPQDVERRLTDYAVRHGWRDRVRQIPKDIEKITRHVAQGVARPAARVSWPPANDNARRLLFKAPRLFEPEPCLATAADALAALYDPKELVCVAPAMTNAHTMRVLEFAPSAATLQFIVANPMRARSGRTQDGNPSARCLENAGDPDRRRFVVVEFDTGDALPDQAAVLSALSSPLAPLVMAVFSGGKSIHGWYRVDGLPSKKHVLALFAYAVYLGADPSLWDMAKLVRFPGGIRDGNIPQPIFYLKGGPNHAR